MRYRSFALWICPLLVGFLAVLGCSRQQESSGSSLSGVDEQPNACTLSEWTEPLLDPAPVFYRSKGKPVTETVSFSVPLDGELCVVVTNGDGDPPHGHRISAAWISIDGELVIGPDPFDQNTAEIKAPHTVTAGDHELSVKLASKPGSFLTVQLMLLARDEEPPVVAIEPAHGSQVDTDMPTITVTYSDAISGVDLNTLLIKLNGVDVTPMFSATEDSASWALNIFSYLEEGDNTVEAWISDQRANEGYASSVFTVSTPTDVLLAGLDDENPVYRKRSAYKLLSRTDEITQRQLWKCLKQLNDTPEPKAVDLLVSAMRSSGNDHVAESLAVSAVGRTGSTREDVVDAIGEVLMNTKSWGTMGVAARAISDSYSEHAIPHLEAWIDLGPINFPKPQPEPPEGMDEEEQARLYPEYFQWLAKVAVVGFQATKSFMKLAGPNYERPNPGKIDEIHQQYLDDIKTYIAVKYGNGGAP